MIQVYQTGSVHHVSTTGNNANSGSVTSPWKTLRYAITKVPVGAGHTIKLAAGTYVEDGLIEVPVGVNIEGAGKDATILKAAYSFYYHPESPAYATVKFLISLTAENYVAGNQVLKNFSIDGDQKKLHGGIYVHHRTHMTLENINVRYTNFTGIWLWDYMDSYMKNVSTLNCSWASSGWQSGAINIGNLERVEFDNVNVDEGVGYGIKAIGPDGINKFKNFIIHNSRISVNPIGTWNGGSAPNIAIELWKSSLVDCKIYNNYLDNTLSLVNSESPAATGVQAVRVYNNVFDLETRSKGSGYAIELSMNDAEIDHNYLIKGTYGIANWDKAMSNWNIHHNVFYGIQGTYPGECLRSQFSGLHNVKFYNNTIEFIGNKTANVIGLYGGSSENLEIKNNLVINSNTSYNYYPNQLIHMENGAAITGLQIDTNAWDILSLEGIVGGVLNTIKGDPKITRTGLRPIPYYVPLLGSPLIDAGINVGLPFTGNKPDIGAFEVGVTTPPIIEPPVTPPPTSYVEVILDASKAVLAGNMKMGNESGAGFYFGVPSGKGSNYYLPPPSSASYTFQIPKADSYTLWVRVKNNNSNSRGFHIYDGKGRWITWRVGTLPVWTWVKVTDVNTSSVVTFSLLKGANTIQFGWLHDNVKIDKVVFTNNPNFIPTK